MLMIRLQRTGRSNTATYRLVVADKARPVKGKFLEIVGHYLPQQNPAVLKFNEPRITEWMVKGAQPSDTVARLLKREGVKGMEKYIQRYAKQKSKGEEAAAADAPAPAAPVAAKPAEPVAEAKPVEVPAEAAPVAEEKPVDDTAEKKE